MNRARRGYSVDVLLYDLCSGFAIFDFKLEEWVRTDHLLFSQTHDYHECILLSLEITMHFLQLGSLLDSAQALLVDAIPSSMMAAQASTVKNANGTTPTVFSCLAMQVENLSLSASLSSC